MNGEKADAVHSRYNKCTENKENRDGYMKKG